MIKTRGIDFTALPDEAFDDPFQNGTGAAVIFGATGGVMEAALRTAAYWIDDSENGELKFVITANRFLRNMVRAIVGTMIEIGLGKCQPDDIRRIILAKDRGVAGTSAPPQGLYLTEIEYR